MKSFEKESEELATAIKRADEKTAYMFARLALSKAYDEGYHAGCTQLSAKTKGTSDGRNEQSKRPPL